MRVRSIPYILTRAHILQHTHTHTQCSVSNFSKQFQHTLHYIASDRFIMCVYHTAEATAITALYSNENNIIQYVSIELKVPLLPVHCTVRYTLSFSFARTCSLHFYLALHSRERKMFISRYFASAHFQCIRWRVFHILTLNVSNNNNMWVHIFFVSNTHSYYTFCIYHQYKFM